MKIYDITQEVFTCNVFPGDTGPSTKAAALIADGDVCNLSTIEMGVHNGTHIDAPWHFIDNGKKIDEMDLEKCIGPAVLVKASGDISAETIRAIYQGNQENPAYQRLLLKGDCSLTLDGAKELVKHQVKLIGVESQSIAPDDAPIPVHRELLKNEVVILEGLDLKDVPSESPLADQYYLSALPLKLGGLDGSPCRAILYTPKEL